jgi:imidazolonepropionase-like amidohydrolase
MLILENARLLDLESGEARPGSHVAIDGGKIVEVADRALRSSTSRRIDLGGRTLLPGLIDAHFHAVLTETNPANSRQIPLTLMTGRAAQLLRRALDRGFTTVRDMGGADWGLRTAVMEKTIAGPRLYIAARGLSQTGGHGDLRPRVDTDEPCGCSSGLPLLSTVADGVPQVQAAAREQLRQGADHLKVFVSGGVVSPNDPLNSLQYTHEELAAVVREAESWGTYVAAHAYSAAAITHAVSAGIRTIEHGNLLDASAARLMAERRAYLVPTLVTYEAMRSRGASLGLSPFSMEKLATVFAAGMRSIELANSAGVRIGLGTDLLGELHSQQSEELTLRARIQSLLDVLRSATLVNAEILGESGRLGVIKAGAAADLIAVNGDPLVDLTLLQQQGRHLDLIVKDGDIHKLTF